MVVGWLEEAKHFLEGRGDGAILRCSGVVQPFAAGRANNVPPPSSKQSAAGSRQQQAAEQQQPAAAAAAAIKQQQQQQSSSSSSSNQAAEQRQQLCRRRRLVPMLLRTRILKSGSKRSSSLLRYGAYTWPRMCGPAESPTLPLPLSLPVPM